MLVCSIEASVPRKGWSYSNDTLLASKEDMLNHFLPMMVVEWLTEVKSFTAVVDDDASVAELIEVDRVRFEQTYFAWCSLSLWMKVKP